MILGYEFPESYDTDHTLIIDPTLSYSTYLGGEGIEAGFSIAVDGMGNAYVTGATSSTNFPTTPGAFQTTLDGFLDTFVTKINATGTALIYSTYLGGSDNEMGAGISTDTNGNAYLTGVTNSTNFPTTPGAFQTMLNGDNAAFVTKINATGTDLIFSTYLGGDGDDAGNDIALDAQGNAFVTGRTESTDFPTTFGAFQTMLMGVQSAFVTKVNASGTDLVYSTYLGGDGGDVGIGIALDAQGNAFATGVTNSTNFPTTLGAFQMMLNGNNAAFVTKVNATGTDLIFSTYLGGDGDDGSAGITVDIHGNTFVTGVSTSTNFPTTLGAFQTMLMGGQSAFVTKVNAMGTDLIFSTYLGGNSDDTGFGIAVDAHGNTFVIGTTESTNFPTTVDAFQTMLMGGQSAFVTKVNAMGTALIFSTYLGGNSDDTGFGITVNAHGNAFVTGSTESINFPTTVGAFQTTLADLSDAFVTKITVPPPPPLIPKCCQNPCKCKSTNIVNTSLTSKVKGIGIYTLKITKRY
ncbi:SBBP repeat-containing protein [Cytobacillus sp. IB215665]|uniref:SBBP repeat-containing protein n=1 Tax=Cytobacillus sp. IB215665 TaxID=3097357 RepID=UPI002A0CD607|nr:SBBP repeat-containing protein [Cytobacillus sp. IB215665]MDX8367213.1 SBBP repeat-containing protein [Cytobacillus sp. IB215665]